MKELSLGWKWLFYTKLIFEEIFEVGGENDSHRGAKYQEKRDKNCESASEEMYFLPFDIPAVEIVSVVVVIILIPTEEMKQNCVQSTTL